MASILGIRGGVEFDLRTNPPLKEFQFRMERFTSGIEDWHDCFTACGQLFQRQMGEQFETEGSASGERWEDVDPNYAAWKSAAGFGDTIGVLTGDLRSSMTGGGGYTEKIEGTRAEFGQSDWADAADYGTYFSEARPVIRMTPEWGREYQKVVHTWLVAEERSAMGIGGSAIGELVRRGGVV